MSIQPTTWTGKPANSQEVKLNIRPNCPFYLMHNPFQWELVNTADDVWEWLPQFSQLNEMAGVNGCIETRQGVDSSHARLRFMEQGNIILDREFGYVTRYKTKFGGYYYCLIWDVPKVIGDRVFWNHNIDDYNTWRKTLLEEGIIDKPEDEVIEVLLSNVDRRINRRVTQQHIPEIKAQIDELYNVKKRMTEAFKTLTEPQKRTRKKQNA